ncbi:membrane protease YdiL (CAAX protease family) [Thermocatellispora tengchongensis]|uniref:Membrane protease YdiL (CAAX protease family) n=1 Tax=Thermocatellispora tengchongensis TaxID=1073253 RepID=A0A840PDA8_9ACTN|nr:type II CAAX endopeptidase family protein [Thermocatellispora tengchongensis]MBB5136706.1 membrane protease YdiL (CAAX protease family) [Thermocatellispora tengchongensis]
MQIVRQHSVASFFVLAYGLSWLAWLPYLLSQDGLGVLPLKFPVVLGDTMLAGIMPGAYLGPLAAAFIVTAIAGGGNGLRQWRARLFRWRMGLRWYALALAGIPALLLLATLVLPGAAAGARLPAAEVFLTYVPLLIVQILTAGLAEEPGWRDFALPRMQDRYGPLPGSVLLGLLWAGWHLPLFVTVWSVDGPDPVEMALFVVAAVMMSIVITWVFNHTRESLPVAILIHGSNNAVFEVVWPQMFPGRDESLDTWLAMVIGYGALSLVLIAFTRGRLGRKPAPSTADDVTSSAGAG